MSAHVPIRDISHMNKKISYNRMKSDVIKSGLQKTIRRCLSNEALSYAIEGDLYSLLKTSSGTGNRTNLVNRLRIILVEDLFDWQTVLLVEPWFSAWERERNSETSRKYLLSIVRALAMAPKIRLVSDFKVFKERSRYRSFLGNKHDDLYNEWNVCRGDTNTIASRFRCLLEKENPNCLYWLDQVDYHVWSILSAIMTGTGGGVGVEVLQRLQRIQNQLTKGHRESYLFSMFAVIMVLLRTQIDWKPRQMPTLMTDAEANQLYQEHLAKWTPENLPYPVTINPQNGKKLDASGWLPYHVVIDIHTSGGRAMGKSAVDFAVEGSHVECEDQHFLFPRLRQIYIDLKVAEVQSKGVPIYALPELDETVATPPWKWEQIEGPTAPAPAPPAPPVPKMPALHISSGPIKIPPVPSTGIVVPPVPSTGIKMPPAPSTGIKIPPAPSTGIKMPPAPSTGIKIPPAPSTGIKMPPAPSTGIKMPPNLVVPPAPSTGIKMPPNLVVPPAPSTGIKIPPSIVVPPAPSTGIKIPPSIVVPPAPSTSIKIPPSPPSGHPPQITQEDLIADEQGSLYGQKVTSGWKPTTYITRQWVYKGPYLGSRASIPARTEQLCHRFHQFGDESALQQTVVTGPDGLYLRSPNIGTAWPPTSHMEIVRPGLTGRVVDRASMGVLQGDDLIRRGEIDWFRFLYHFIVRYIIGAGDAGFWNYINNYGIDFEENRKISADPPSLIQLMFNKAPAKDLMGPINTAIKQLSPELIKRLETYVIPNATSEEQRRARLAIKLL
jgi:hypothetical protein